jgi:hypothetical protein
MFLWGKRTAERVTSSILDAIDPSGRPPHKISEFHRITEVEETPVDTETEFACDLVRNLRDWWFEAGQGGLPRKRAFDIADHPRLAASIFLVEIQNGEFWYRVRGEEVLQMLGGSERGKRVAAHRAEDYGHLLGGYYATVLEARRPYRCRGTLGFMNKAHVRFESIDCPLADDEDSPRFILGVIEMQPNRGNGQG